MLLITSLFILEYSSFNLNLEFCTAFSSSKFQFLIAYSFNLSLSSKNKSTCQIFFCSSLEKSNYCLLKNFLLDKLMIVYEQTILSLSLD